MNKRDLIVTAASKSNGSITQISIQQGFELILRSTLEALAKGEKITIANFGTFFVKKMPERKGRNPSTGEAIIIGPRKVVKFKIAENFTFDE